jgi:hypothetical protein
MSQLELDFFAKNIRFAENFTFWAMVPQAWFAPKSVVED